MVDITLALIATINISIIMTVDKVFIPIREFFGIKHVNDYPDTQKIKLKGIRGYIGKILSCFKCTSVWISLFIVMLWYCNRKLYRFITAVFTLSWFATIFNHLVDVWLQKLRLT